MGGSFSQSSSRSRSRPVDITPQQYAGLRTPTADFLRDALRGGPQYAGPFAAELTDAELESMGRIGSFMARSPSGTSRGMLEDTLRGTYLRPESNPFLADYIAAAQRPLLEAATDRAIADRATFARAGHRLPSSSPFAYAESVRERGLANALGDVSTRIAGDAYQRERGNQIAAAQQLEAINQGDFNRMVEKLKVDALPRLIEQLGYDRGLEEFRRRVNLAAQAAGIAGDLSSQFSTESQASSSSFSAGVDLGQITYGGG